MMTSAAAIHPIIPRRSVDHSIDYEALDQFATSVAAMATLDATPLAVLENVLGTIAENLNASLHCTRFSAEGLLLEKALRYGYDDVALFRRHIVKLIGERMIDLQISQLSAIQRQTRKAS